MNGQLGAYKVWPVKAELKYTNPHQKTNEVNDWVEVFHIVLDENGNYQNEFEYKSQKKSSTPN